MPRGGRLQNSGFGSSPSRCHPQTLHGAEIRLENRVHDVSKWRPLRAICCYRCGNIEHGRLMEACVEGPSTIRLAPPSSLIDAMHAWEGKGAANQVWASLSWLSPVVSPIQLFLSQLGMLVTTLDITISPEKNIFTPTSPRETFLAMTASAGHEWLFDPRTKINSWAFYINCTLQARAVGSNLTPTF